MVKDKVFWYEEKDAQRPPLDRNSTADIVIVGGGMAGLMCAHALAKAGKSVILLEKYFCGAGASGKSSGFISPDSELELSDLIKFLGKERAKQLWDFNLEGIRRIKGIIEDYHIECDYQDQDCCYIASSKADIKNIQREHDAREQLGHPSKLYNRQSLPFVLGSQSFFAGVRYTDTYGIDGFRFCQELAKELEHMGVSIFEQTPVTGVESKKVYSGNFVVTAATVVLCTDRFLPELGFLKPDLFQLQTFLAVSKPLTIDEVKTIFPAEKMMVWDSKLIYQYFRITGGNRVLLGAANMWFTYTRKEHHRPEQIIRRHERFFRKKFPGVQVEWEYVWPGMVGVSKDVLPIAGQSREEPSHFYISAATGLPWAAELGYFIADKITSQAVHPLDDVFSPYRRYPVGRGIQNILGKPLSFLLSHYMTKYFGKIV